MPDIKWVKLTTDMFDDEKIRIIRKMPEADAILNTWVQLICLAGKCNDGGYIYLSETLPYTDEMLATVLERELPIVRLALSTLSKLQMIDWQNGDHLVLPNFEKHQNIDGMERVRELTAARNIRYRQRIKARQQLALPEGRDVTVTQHDATDKTKNRYIEKNREEVEITFHKVLETLKDRVTLLNYQTTLCHLEFLGITENEIFVAVPPDAAERIETGFRSLIENAVAVTYGKSLKLCVEIK